MDTAIYIIWGLVPTFYFLMALWLILEGYSGKKRSEEAKDFFKQGIFVLVCVGIAFAINEYIFVPHVNPLVEDLLPPFLIKLFLLPIILYAAALIAGPTKQIRISKAPKVGARKRR